MKNPKRRPLVGFLVTAAVVYAGLAIFAVLDGLYVVAIANVLTGGLALMVARMITTVEQKGPSLLLSSAFLAALVGVNIIIWLMVV